MITKEKHFVFKFTVYERKRYFVYFMNNKEFERWIYKKNFRFLLHNYFINYDLFTNLFYISYHACLTFLSFLHSFSNLDK